MTRALTSKQRGTLSRARARLVGVCERLRGLETERDFNFAVKDLLVVVAVVREVRIEVFESGVNPA